MRTKVAANMIATINNTVEGECIGIGRRLIKNFDALSVATRFAGARAVRVAGRNTVWIKEAASAILALAALSLTVNNLAGTQAVDQSTGILTLGFQRANLDLSDGGIAVGARQHVGRSLEVAIVTHPRTTIIGDEFFVVADTTATGLAITRDKNAINALRGTVRNGVHVDAFLLENGAIGGKAANSGALAVIVGATLASQIAAHSIRVNTLDFSKGSNPLTTDFAGLTNVGVVVGRDDSGAGIKIGVNRLIAVLCVAQDRGDTH